MAFATSAVRDANTDDALARRNVRGGGGSAWRRPGPDESRLDVPGRPALVYGCERGPITNPDIGGGSLEMSTGLDEAPEVVLSLPLGAAGSTRGVARRIPPSRRRLATGDGTGHRAGGAATLRGLPIWRSARPKTFRSLAGIGERLGGGSVLTAAGCGVIAFTCDDNADRAELEGVIPSARHRSWLVLWWRKSMRAPWNRWIFARGRYVKQPFCAGSTARPPGWERRQMSSDTDDDGQITRPISVAELLARNGTIGALGGRTPSALSRQQCCCDCRRTHRARFR